MLATILISILIFGYAAFVIKNGIKKSKNGASSCGSGCSGCSGCSSSHNNHSTIMIKK